MTSSLYAIVACAFGCVVVVARLPSQSAPAPARALPERLMIGPEEYLRAPTAFPIHVPPGSDSSAFIRARNIAPREWAMTHAEPCRQVAVTDTAGWVTINGLIDPGTIRLPSRFASNTTFRAYHGGLQWNSSTTALTVENGWWGAPYDSKGYLTACRVRVRAGEYLVGEFHAGSVYSFVAIPWTLTWGPSTMIRGSAETEAELRALWTAFMTMIPPQCRYVTGEPVRDPRSPAC